ncbi:MAG TPA: hypothetical protein VFH75_03655 [Actinomycetota bacterium]|nr:hypothetical protein [Actinomycetota bacterium]
MEKRLHERRFAVGRAMVVAAVFGGLLINGPAPAGAQVAPCESLVLDFAGLPAGTLLGEQYASGGIHMSAIANEGRPNQLIVFDADAPWTPDPDLMAANGNLAIIPEHLMDDDLNGLVDVPNDSIRGGKQIYTFDHERTVGSFTIVDIDHGDPDSHYASAFDGSGNLIVKVPIIIGVDGNVQNVDVNASGVRRLEITYRDSSGVTAMELGCPPGPPGEGEGCTPGYWKQEQHFDSWRSPYDPNDSFNTYFENAFPEMTLLEVLKQGGGGLNALGRHTVAAMLNSASGGVDYAFSSAAVIASFDAVYPGTKGDYETLKNQFAGENERGCPLN